MGLFCLLGQTTLYKEYMQMISKIWRKLANREAVSYIIFGVLTTLVDWVSYTVFWAIGMDYRVSTALSWAAAVMFVFVTN